METKYIVKVLNIFYNLVEVSAKDPSEAKEKTKEIIQQNQKFQHFYEATFPVKDWRVIRKEDLIKEQNKAFEHLVVEDEDIS